MHKRLLVAVTGASALPLAVRFLEVLKKQNIERHLVVSRHAQDVKKYETQKDILWETLCEKLYQDEDISSSVCSGSYPSDGMVVIPCSMNTLAHIAHGIENSVVTRAVGVHLKQERKVVLVPRETPLSLIHLENMLLAKKAGCSIVPPTLAFYFYPQTIDDLMDFIVGKILELFSISHTLYPLWQKKECTEI
ncbi:MAG: UbiX family flavin prenyltransferase [Candidatus Brocadiae bacterium]|nr:UbiX family flavin prenyltransferase [Candidatus Brocadiia bacterium]